MTLFGQEMTEKVVQKQVDWFRQDTSTGIGSSWHAALKELEPLKMNQGSGRGAFRGEWIAGASSHLPCENSLPAGPLLSSLVDCRLVDLPAVLSKVSDSEDVSRTQPLPQSQVLASVCTAAHSCLRS